MFHKMKGFSSRNVDHSMAVICLVISHGVNVWLRISHNYGLIVTLLVQGDLSAGQCGMLLQRLIVNFTVCQ
jgi:hypothetical protein